MRKFAALLPSFTARPYQNAGVHVAVSSPNGTVIFAHPVGSGKTGTSLAAAEKLRELGRGRKVLAIVPAGLKENFAAEGVSKFTDGTARVYQSSAELAGATGDADYHVMSYELFKRNPQLAIEKTGADTIILDEVHHLKNPQTGNYKMLKEIRPLVKNVIGVTGSVVSTNGIYDLYHLVDALSGGSHDLGPPREFEQRYIRRASGQKGDKRSGRSIVGFRNTAELAEKIQQYVHYVAPETVASQGVMPRKQVQEVNVPMTPGQAQLYRQTMKGHGRILKMLRSKHPEAHNSAELAKAYNSLIVARQLSNALHTVDPEVDLAASPVKSPKIKRVLDDLVDHLKTTPDGQVVVFTNLIKGGIDALEEGLKQRGVPFGRFIGKGNEGITDAGRNQDVREFNSGKKKVILVSGAGAEGLSFNNTTMAQVLDPHWNPERILQPEARGIRLGGLSHRPIAKREVIVRRYKSTIPSGFLFWKSQKPALDDAIYNAAWARDKQNKLVRDVLGKPPDAFRSPIQRFFRKLVGHRRRPSWMIPAEEREANRQEYLRRKMQGKT